MQWYGFLPWTGVFLFAILFFIVVIRHYGRRSRWVLFSLPRFYIFTIKITKDNKGKMFLRIVRNKKIKGKQRLVCPVIDAIDENGITKDFFLRIAKSVHKDINLEKLSNYIELKQKVINTIGTQILLIDYGKGKEPLPNTFYKPPLWLRFSLWFKRESLFPRNKIKFYFTPEPNGFGLYEGGLYNGFTRFPALRRLGKTHSMCDDITELFAELCFFINQWYVRDDIKVLTLTTKWYDDYKTYTLGGQDDPLLIERDKVLGDFDDYCQVIIQENLDKKDSVIDFDSLETVTNYKPVYLRELMERLRKEDMVRIIEYLHKDKHFKLQPSGLVTYEPSVYLKEQLNGSTI